MKAMIRTLCRAAVLVLLATPAWAAPKKYHFALASLTAKSDVDAEAARSAQPRLESQLTTAFATHPELIAKLDGAPDWKTQAEPFRRYLARKGIAAAYSVTVELTAATERLEPLPDKPKSQRLIVRVALHMLGEGMPGRTMGFTGDGEATVKVEVGKKVSDRDRQYAWDEASKAAVADALKTAFKQLALPPKKP